MIVVRRARLTDLPVVRKLTLETVAYGIPEGRDIPNKTVQENARNYLKDLERLVHRKKEAAFLVAVDETRVVGFLILEFNHVEDSTGEPQSYIYNLAVDPDYWGRYVVHQLVREAARVSHQHGFRYMTSKISASNRRTVVQALRLGFQIERYQMTMACSSEGIAEMPGRLPEEKAHALSRQLRRRRQSAPKPESGELS